MMSPKSGATGIQRWQLRQSPDFLSVSVAITFEGGETISLGDDAANIRDLCRQLRSMPLMFEVRAVLLRHLEYCEARYRKSVGLQND